MTDSKMLPSVMSSTLSDILNDAVSIILLLHFSIYSA